MAKSGSGAGPGSSRQSVLVIAEDFFGGAGIQIGKRGASPANCNKFLCRRHRRTSVCLPRIPLEFRFLVFGATQFAQCAIRSLPSTAAVIARLKPTIQTRRLTRPSSLIKSLLNHTEPTLFTGSF